MHRNRGRWTGEAGEAGEARASPEFRGFTTEKFFASWKNDRVVDHLPLMTYGLKLSLEAWILKLKKKIIQ